MVRAWAAELGAQADPHGRATPLVQQRILELEREHAAAFTTGARHAFQTMAAQLGARIAGPIQMPEDDTPYWLLGEHPLAGYRSSPELPVKADVVVIGAGLTGASTAWHLAPLVRQGLKVVVLEAGDPACRASGRNGGNFELMPENFLGEYEGLPRERYKWLKRCHPKMNDEERWKEAHRQAEAVFRFGSRNTRAFLSIVAKAKIDCDLSASGWLRIADTEREEQGIFEEVRFARRVGVKFELWDPARIAAELSIAARYSGRLAARNGNYHPFKFVCGVFANVVRRGVNLQTRTEVVGLSRHRDGVRVETARGAVRARRVVFATNAFTSRLLPELSHIQYYQSQILNLEHVRDTIRGMTVTEKKGDLYYNFPGARRYTTANGETRGMLHCGGGLDRPGKDPFALRRSNGVLELVKGQVDERFPETVGQPPSRCWTGPMAFTPDRLPVIGFHSKKGYRGDSLIVAAGFNGYGGTYCVEAGRVAAGMVSNLPASTR